MKIKILVTVLMTMFIVTMNMQGQTTSRSKKVLIAYFSHSGNTKIVAEQIKSITGGDIFEIQPVEAYSTDYNTVVEQAKKEINSNYKPALKSKVQNMDSYDIIFVGSPNWWGTIAPPVSAFLAAYDLSGKTIVPFITHEGTAIGRSVDDIKSLSPKSTVLNGLPIRGGKVSQSKEDVSKWLKEIKVVK